MSTFFNYFIYWYICLFVLFNGHTDAFGQAADEFVDRLRERYDNVELLKAEFTQQTTSPFGEDMPVNRGTIIIEGDNYRVETEDQTFVTNGEIIWIYDSSQNQVLINDFVKDESTFILSDFLDSFHTDYEILSSEAIQIDGVQHYELRLNALEAASFFKEVFLVVRDSDDIITRIKVFDVNDSILDFSLDDIEINPEVEGDPFTFVPPDDAEIIDLRS